jgi:hypothetical protein
MKIVQKPFSPISKKKEKKKEKNRKTKSNVFTVVIFSSPFFFIPWGFR